MSDSEFRKETIGKAKRIVIKVGSGVLTHHTEIIDSGVIESLAADMSRIIGEGREIVIVSSGAIAAGSKKLGFKARPRSIPEKQAAAAVGQSTLIGYYERAFGVGGHKVAQILLTGDGLSERGRYLNARNTIFKLLQYGVVPIINENDTVAVDEIRFGDNDNLSAMVAGLVDADLLIILTDTEGLYDMDPKESGDARIIHTVTAEAFDKLTAGASAGLSAVGTGGMVTKKEAARKAATFGIPVVIANGERAGVLLDVMRGEEVGTIFVPRDEKLRGKKRWLAYSRAISGKLAVDAGARMALEKGGSLLPSGVVAVEGSFGFGDLVSICEEGGGEFARGLVQFSSREIDSIRGLKTSAVENLLGKKDYCEVIHRDDMVFI